MNSPHSGLDATLFSAPGSPYAFSTALKTAGNVEKKKRPVELQSEVPGRLSLESVGSDVPLLPSNKQDKALQSPNETALSDSLGILDLDALGDTGVSQFLTPSNDDVLKLRLSVQTSARSSTLAPQMSVPNQVPVVKSLTNQMTMMTPPITSKLDMSSSSEGELVLSAGELEQLDVTLTDESDHSPYNSLLPRQTPQKIPSPLKESDNPFEDYSGSFGGVEFEAQSQTSFLEQLARDEREVNLTPSDSQLTSFRSTVEQGDGSMDTYFKEKSNKLGQLSSRLSPSQRPQFNNSTSHEIVSPDVSKLNNTTSVTPSLPSQTLPTTLVSADTNRASISSADGLPSLYLHNHFTPTTTWPSTQESRDWSAQSRDWSTQSSSQGSVTGLPSQYLNTDQTPNSQNRESSLPSQHNQSLSASQSDSREQLLCPPKKLSLSTSQPDHRESEQPSQNPRIMQNPSTDKQNSSLPTPLLERLSRGSGSPSQLLQTGDSTLVFPELSVLSSLPSEAGYHMTTPPSGYLPVGFEVTQVPSLSDNESLAVTTEEVLHNNESVLESVVTDHVISADSSLSQVHRQANLKEPSPSPRNQSKTESSFSKDFSSSKSTNGLVLNTTPMADNSSVFNGTPMANSPNGKAIVDNGSVSNGKAMVDNGSVSNGKAIVDNGSVSNGTAMADNGSVSNGTAIADNGSVSNGTAMADNGSVSNGAVMVDNGSVSSGTAMVDNGSASNGTAMADNGSVSNGKAIVDNGSVSNGTAMADSTTLDIDAFLESQPLKTPPHLSPFVPALSVQAAVDQPSTSSTLSQIHTLNFSAPFYTLSSSLPVQTMCARTTPTQSKCHTLITPHCHNSPSLRPLSPQLTSPQHTRSSQSPPTSAEIPREWLEVSPVLMFREVCCVGVCVSESLEVANNGDRWLQVTLTPSSLTRDGLQISMDSVFTLTQRWFVGPRSKEQVKVTFTPTVAGTYIAILSVYGALVVSSPENPRPLTSVQLSARAELPCLLVPTPHSKSLQFGIVVGGASLRVPLELINCGGAPLPLKMAINTEDPLHRMYFTVESTSQTVPPSPPSQPHSVTLSLPSHPHSKPQLFHIQLLAPKLYQSETPPLEIRGSLDISLNSPHSTTQTLVSLPILAVVGVAKLLAPGSFQGSQFTLSCLIGHSKTERVPLKNAGNIPLDVLARMSHPELFLVSPNMLNIQPGQESYVDVTFAPTSDPGMSEVNLQLHVDPNGPDYELKMRGVAIQLSPSEVVTPRPVTVQHSDRPQTESSSHVSTKRISKWLSEVTHNSLRHTHQHSSQTSPHTIQPSHKAQESSPRHSAYIREEEVVFQPTPSNTRSTLKVQVCNRDLPMAQFTVIKPPLPFIVDHHSFRLGSRQCARLPIHFNPAMPGKYTGVVALRTDQRHQMFVVVRGECIKP